MMALGAESVFVGSGVFKSDDPPRTARAIVQAVTHWQDPAELVRIMEDFAGPMRGLDIAEIPEAELLSKRGW
jgi:pyridoxal 5'-phosphate synthase pdxS subunit